MDLNHTPSFIITALILLLAGCESSETQSLTASLPTSGSRVWVGQNFYANRLLDWQIQDGRIESIEGRAEKPMRTLHVITRSLSESPGSVSMSVQTGPINEAGPPHVNTWTGFLIGAGGDHVDFRISSLVHHWPAEDGGLIFALDGNGQIVARDNSTNEDRKGRNDQFTAEDWPLIEPISSDGTVDPYTTVTLTIEATPEGERYAVTVKATSEGETLATAAYADLDPIHFSGNIALVSHNSPSLEGPGYWFKNWHLSGTKVLEHPDRAFGPIMSTMYTLSDNVLTLTAQMPPLGESDNHEVSLELRTESEWQTAANTTIIDGSFTATFRVPEIPIDRDVPFRVVYQLRSADDELIPYHFEGVIRKPKLEDDEFVLASLNCQNISTLTGVVWNHSTIWYPHNEITDALAHHDPDMLFFAGDQIYEGGLAGIVRTPLDTANLDYQYHWYRFIWTFRDLMKDRPTIAIPDDHDVYHGNIWGAGGIKAEGEFRPITDNGGYIMDPLFVNAVHRTQVSNLPPPYDPTPIEQDITVYYTDVQYGGISFGVVADRMWKSPPRKVLPEANVRNGWPHNRDYDPTTVTEATLLGERQLTFLEDWAGDYSGDTWMKVMLSQTLFSNLATLPEGFYNDGVVPQMRYAEPGEYISTDHTVGDMDSNGWPQAGRNRALRTIRKGFAFHVGGDQHLGSFVHYGIDEFGDGPNAFISPAIANIWPRRWFPPNPGNNRKAGAPENTGEHFDGFGNRMTVHAVANPVRNELEPEALYNRVPGYGIIRFNRADRTITAEAWPRWVDPSTPDATQYNGWPVVVSQESNYGRTPAGHLPLLEFSGTTDPVIQVIEDSTGEVVYTFRVQGASFRPQIFDTGSTYTISVQATDGQLRTIESLSVASDEQESINVSFE